MPILWRCGEPSGKWICVQPFAHFLISPGVRPEFIEDGYADDADVLCVVIFLGGVRFADWTKTKCGDRFGTLSKPFHYELRPRRHHVTGFAKRCFAPVEDIEAVDRQNNFKAQISSVADDD